MTKQKTLHDALRSVWDTPAFQLVEALGELTLTIDSSALLPVMTQLRDHAEFAFDILIDVCGVDYLHYGLQQWETDAASSNGFSRAVNRCVVDKDVMQETTSEGKKPRFAVVYHLLSTTQNHRLRVKVCLDEALPVVASVVSIWRSANWFEREAYDMFGILFDDHPDLRRVLTDYGFIGHPFRKDFPVSGHVEMRYDAALEKVIYEPVDIEPRTLVPKVIRQVNKGAAS
ncbi:MAG: NADH-quinone oxidoreductase subunit C [Gammaproteobacteria bacterium]|nr:NADH-quinone oxidoreductase subunit C [Gammaproteobacteria bacterium]